LTQTIDEVQRSRRLLIKKITLNDE